MLKRSVPKIACRQILLLVSGVALLGGQEPYRTVTVILRDLYGVRPVTASRMESDVAKIFLRAGIQLHFVTGAATTVPVPGSYELQLLGGDAPGKPGVLGRALLGERSGQYAALYVETIRKVASDACWGEAELLARVGAHELGHLLLNSPDHSRAGLMQANWAPEYLLRIPHTQLVFLSDDVEMLNLRFGRMRTSNFEEVI